MMLSSTLSWSLSAGRRWFSLRSLSLLRWSSSLFLRRVPRCRRRTASWWHLESSATPTNLTPGGEGAIFVTVTNLGDETVNATTNTVTIADVLPAALRGSVTSISQTSIAFSRRATGTMTCTLASLSCTFSGTVKPYESLRVTLFMKEVALGAVSGERTKSRSRAGRAHRRHRCVGR